MIANKLYKWLASTFVPDVAKNMEKEGTFNLGEEIKIDLDENPHVLVEDRGSDITIFSFAGMAVLFAGLPAFEFRKLLQERGDDYNLVFFRDVTRTAYITKPDGTAGGPEFYEAEVNRIIKELGSGYNVAMGASAGGAMAFYMGMNCNMDQIVTFSPVLSRDVYTDPSHVFRNIFNIRALFREPQAYFEVVLMTLGALAIKRKIDSKFKDRMFRDVHKFYLAMESNRPLATIYHGERCGPDCITANRLAHLDEVKTVPVDTGRHNCAAIIKREGRMGAAVLDEVRRGIEIRGYQPRTVEEPPAAQASGA